MSPTTSRWPLVLTSTSLAALWGLSLLLWPQLPERIPLHFAASGVPDRVGPASALNWFMLPGIATGMTALFLGINALVRRLVRTGPQWINLPDKERFLALPEQARMAVMRHLFAMLQGLPAYICLLFAWIVWGTYSVATGRMERLPFWTALPLLGLLAAGIIWAVVATRRAIAAEFSRLGR